MKPFAIVALLAAPVLTSGCTPSQTQPGTVDPDAFSHVYTCAGDQRFALRADADGEAAVLTRDGRDRRLARRPTATGRVYAAEGIRFRGEGGRARLSLPDGVLKQCRAAPAYSPWQEAALLGIDFRGLGQEPGWILDIDTGHWMHLRAEYGRREVFMPVPDPRHRKGAWVYHVSTEQHELRVVIHDQACRDAMSGAAFPRTVRVTLDGDSWSGCGRWLTKAGHEPHRVR